MASKITILGEKLFAKKAQANEPLDIDTFIFANVPEQDPSAEIDRDETVPIAAQQVHTQAVQQVGRINDNVVVYSTVLDSVTGDFEFNWVGLYSSVNDTLVAINHIPTTTKTKTVFGVAGNTLNRNFGIEYSGIADLTGINVAPETWQLDFTARLSGMDELTRNLAKDLNGTDYFIDEGFKVSPRATANTFSVSPGVGYINGLRVELTEEQILIADAYPKFVYVDAFFDGEASSVWKPKHQLSINSNELVDYIDGTGKQHYVFKLAVLNAADDVEDLREDSGLANREWVKEGKVLQRTAVSTAVSESLQEYYGRSDFCPEMFGAVGNAEIDSDENTDDSEAVLKCFKAANVLGGNVKFASVYEVNGSIGEIEITRPMTVHGNGSGTGYGDNALTEYKQTSGLLVTGDGAARVRTKSLWRGSEEDAEDSPLSCVMNVQNEFVQMRDFSLFLWFDRADQSPTNFGANWDVGIFNGCRAHHSLHNVHTVGYWREAGIYLDVTRNADGAEHSRLDGSPYERGTVHNGCDGFKMDEVYSRGGLWAVKVQGSEPKVGDDWYGDDYFDQDAGSLVNDKRGSFGASDFNAFKCSLYGADHHSNYRRNDFTGNPVDDKSGGVMSISGMAGNSSKCIQGFRFLSTRFATFEAFRIKLGRCNRPQFFGCHIEPRNSNRMDTNGNAIDTGDYDSVSYGQICASDDTNNIVSIGLNVTLNKNWLSQTANASLTELAQATTGAFQQMKGQLRVDAYRAFSEFDMRSEAGEIVRMRVGSETKLILDGNEGLLFGDTLENPTIAASTGELDLRCEYNKLIRMRHGNSTMARFDGGNNITTLYGLVRPNLDNNQALGTVTARWSELHAANDTINTSDSRDKKQRGELTESELKAWSKVSPKIYKWIDSIERKGQENARLNSGYIAQDIEAAFKSEGLDAADYALWCEDPVYKTVTKYRTVKKQRVKSVDIQKEHVEVIDGAAIVTYSMEKVDKPVIETVPLLDKDKNQIFDEDGEKKTHTYVVMDDVEEAYETTEDSGEVRYGLRYSHCLVFECAYLRSMIKSTNKEVFS